MAVETQLTKSSSETLRGLYRFMSRRWFVASRSELLAAGFSSSQIRNWVRHDRLVLLLRGVYSFGRDVNNREGAFRAALLAAGPDSVLVGRSACEQWGIVARPERVPHHIEVGVPIGDARRLRGLSRVLRNTTVSVVRRRVDPEEIRQVNGLAVTSVLVALVDFAGRASPRQLRFAFLEACRLGLVQRHDMRPLRKLMAGRRGVEKLKPLIDLMLRTTE